MDNQPTLPIESFQGLYSNHDPNDLEPGQAQAMLNCWSPRPGELLVRPGLREMTWDS
jgi:hypothetical protein